MALSIILFYIILHLAIGKWNGGVWGGVCVSVHTWPGCQTMYGFKLEFGKYRE